MVFVGSSSIRMWETLEADFPGLPVLNRGFGGSELSDVVRFADRIVVPYKPRVVVVYAGDNDLAAGKTPAQVFADFRSLRRDRSPEASGSANRVRRDQAEPGAA